MSLFVTGSSPYGENGLMTVLPIDSFPRSVGLMLEAEGKLSPYVVKVGCEVGDKLVTGYRVGEHLMAWLEDCSSRGIDVNVRLALAAVRTYIARTEFEAKEKKDCACGSQNVYRENRV